MDTEDQEKLPESTPISSTAVAGQEIDGECVRREYIPPIEYYVTYM